MQTLLAKAEEWAVKPAAKRVVLRTRQPHRCHYGVALQLIAIEANAAAPDMPESER